MAEKAQEPEPQVEEEELPEKPGMEPEAPPPYRPRPPGPEHQFQV